MQKQINKKSIGLFFVVGLSVFILIVAGSFISRFWSQNSYTAVMYFDESTQGLNVGAPVVFNGVQIGKVEKISLEANPRSFVFKVPVYVQITPINISGDDMDIWKKMMDHRGTTLARLIKMGLRARLRTQSFLTGQLMIELSIEKDAPLNLVHNWIGQKDVDVPEIPTLLSASGKLSKGLNEMQFQTIFDKINTILEALDKDLPQLLEAITKSAENMEKITTIVSMDTVDRTNKTLTEVSEAMRSLRNLTDYLEQYPESLLKGKKE